MEDITYKNDLVASKNFIASTALVLGTIIGAGLGAWLFHLDTTGLFAVSFFSISIDVGMFADAYHRSFTDGTSATKLTVRFFLASLISTFVLAGLYSLKALLLH